MPTSFRLEPTADDIPVTADVSLAADRSANPRIVFSRSEAGRILMRRRDGGTWSR